MTPLESLEVPKRVRTVDSFGLTLFRQIVALCQSQFDSIRLSRSFRFKYDSPKESNVVFDSVRESKYLGHVI